MNKGSNRPNVIRDLFRERERFANEAADALPQGVVHSFDMRGAPRCFAAWSMAFAGQNGGIGGPEVGIGDRTLTVHGGQRGPQRLRGGLIPQPNRDTDNFTGVTIQGQPNPLWCLLGLDKRPEFVAFERQWAFFLGERSRFWTRLRMFC